MLTKYANKQFLYSRVVPRCYYHSVANLGGGNPFPPPTHTPSLILGKKKNKKITEGRKSGRAKQNQNFRHLQSREIQLTCFGGVCIRFSHYVNINRAEIIIHSVRGTDVNAIITIRLQFHYTVDTSIVSYLKSTLF